MKNEVRTLHKRVLHYIVQEKLWRAGQSVILSISGGVDSMVMLDIVVRTQGAHKGNLQVITFDHGLRPESERETQLVMKAAQDRGIQCTLHRLKLNSGSRLQERARDARRAVLLSYLDAQLATAHHANDQAETILYRLLRGSGLTGLRAMLPRQGRFVRPLLSISKPEIIAYARDRDIHWMEDPSNSDSLRGQLREVFPVLEGIRRNSTGSLARSARLLARDEAFLEVLTTEKFQLMLAFDRLPFLAVSSQHPAIQLRLLRRLAALSNLVPSATQLESFLSWKPLAGGKLSITGGFQLVFDGEHLFFEKV